MIGNILGNRYTIIREIGTGGMAWVYLAEDIKEGGLVAIKVLYPQFVEDVSYVQRFKREAKLASTLRNPHIVQVLDYGADRDTYYLVMEFISGRDIRTILDEKGAFLWQEALEIIDQLAVALEDAYAHGVVHRDIKPQNLMIDSNGLLRVLDFGIARIDNLPSLTQSGFIGSPYYVSPEQAMGDEVDTRSDIYSAGIVLYELLSGKIPFDAKSPWSVISKHVSSEPPSLEKLKAKIPASVQTLLNTMVAKKPDDRYQTPTQLRRAITETLADSSRTPDSPGPDKAVLLASLYERATRAINIEHWARSASLLRHAVRLDVDYEDAKAKLELAEKQATLLAIYNTAKIEFKNNFWQDAIKNFDIILSINPKYKDVAELREQAQNALERQTTQPTPVAAPTQQPEKRTTSQTGWALAVGFLMVIVLVGGSFIWFNTATPSGGNNVEVTPNPEDELRQLYQEAQQAIENDQTGRALALLNEIKSQDPNYADVTALIRDISPTPTPGAESSVEEALNATLDEAQVAIDNAEWTQAITLLSQIREEAPKFEAARVSSLFCDAYVGRGLQTINQIEDTAEKETTVALMEAALSDFQVGTAECPRRTDLSDQAERASTYLEAWAIEPDDHEAIIQLLSPLVAAAPNYAKGQAKNMLYDIYLARGDAYRAAGEMVQALSDYEAAASLNVANSSAVQTRRAELLIELSSPPTVAPTVSQPVAIEQPAEVRVQEEVTATATITPTFASETLPAPQLVTEEDMFAAGPLTEVFLEWKPVPGLSENQYYDLTISHMFGNEIQYWGRNEGQETRVQIPPDIGVGEAGQDRFYWWVTVREDNPEGDDLPVSEQSEVRSFIWTAQ